MLPTVSGSDTRDDWMKRTGPFYPLLVSFRLQTNLPVAESLSPTEADLRRSAPWLIAVGVIVGVSLSLLGRVLLWSPLVPAISATLLITIGVFLTGAYAERGLTSVVVGLMGSAGGAGSGHLLAAALLRLGLLLGTATHAWSAAFVVAAVAGKVTYLVAVARPQRLLHRDPDDDEAEGFVAGMTPAAWAIAAAVALLAVVAYAGLAGFIALVIAVGIGAAGQRKSSDRSASLVGIAELAAFIIIAAGAPAAVSPLISP